MVPTLMVGAAAGLIGSAEPVMDKWLGYPAHATGNKIMTNTTAANGKEAAYHGVPAEDNYGYAQAIKIGNTIHVSGQLSQDDKGTMIAPAALDESSKPADFIMFTASSSPPRTQ
jgi:enamine deaminase RidA (YjgF/YER057c/UK114 family)